MDGGSLTGKEVAAAITIQEIVMKPNGLKRAKMDRKAAVVVARAHSLRRLKESDVLYVEYDRGFHLGISLPNNGGIVDFWTGTQKWIRRSDRESGHGVEEVIAMVKGELG